MAEPFTFADLVRSRDRGKLKLYVGSAAGVGKTYRMLQEAHGLVSRGVDVVIGFVETHRRRETVAQIGALELVPRKVVQYRGVALEEMDTDAVIARRPEVALVDELAHTNVPDSGRAKRWEDVMALLDEGISVISAVNIQHVDSLHQIIQRTLGVTVRETIPDWVVGTADQVVNLDISAEDLRERMSEGKIYTPDKIAGALNGFFTHENLTTLRELALREVASSVDRVREEAATRAAARRPHRRTVDRLMVAMPSDAAVAGRLLRTATRIAGRLNQDWYGVYVQTPRESAARIDATVQRNLVAIIQRAEALGAEVVKVQGDDVARALLAVAVEREVSMMVVGRSERSWWRRMLGRSVTRRLLANRAGIDILIVAPGSVETEA